MPPEKETEVTDEEWEWEYHDTETEDFYVPIVLPTVLTTTSGKNTGRKTRSKQQSIKRDENRQMQQQQQQQQQTPTNPSSTDGNQNSTVEITKINTSNPEVTYRGYTYTCDWATTIGTDMFFAKPDSSETTRTKTAQQRQSTTAPAEARQLPTIDGSEANTSLLGTGRVKLVAKQVRKVAVAPQSGSQPQPEEQDRSEFVAQPTSSNAAEVNNNTNESQRPTPNPQNQLSPAIPAASASASKSNVTSSLSSTLKRRQEQESFLSRLIEIKRRRGDADADAVPMYGVGWGPLKSSAETEEIAAADGLAGQDIAVQYSEDVSSNNGGGGEGNVDNGEGENGGETMDTAD